MQKFHLPKLGLFDLDGTLVHHEHDYFFDLYSKIFAELGKKPLVRESFDKKIKDHSLFSFLDINEEERKDFVEEFWNKMDQHPFPIARAYEKTFHTLDYFLANNCKIAIVTARTQIPDEVRDSLKQCGILKFIDHISTLGEPHLFTRSNSPMLKVGQVYDVCKKLRISPSDSLMVGDSPSDVTSGRAAGVKLTAALLSGALEPELLLNTNPHIVLTCIGDLPQHFP